MQKKSFLIGLDQIVFTVKSVKKTPIFMKQRALYIGVAVATIKRYLQVTYCLVKLSFR